MHRGAIADLLPVLAVEEGHFVTVDGRIGTALTCTGINLSIQSDEAAATIAALFADTLNYLPLGAHLELVAVNSPLRAEEWVPQHCAQFSPPDGLTPYIGHLAEAYRRELGGQHIPDLRFYAILSLPSIGEGHRRRTTRRTLQMHRAAHNETLAALTQAASELAMHLLYVASRGCTTRSWASTASGPPISAPIPIEGRSVAAVATMIFVYRNRHAIGRR